MLGIVRALPRRRAHATSASPTPPATPTRRRSKRCSARSARSTTGVELACHFHNTYGLGLANCYAALQRRRDVVRVGVRRPRRLPVHQGRRPATSAPRTSCTCCSAWALRTDIDLDAARRRRRATSAAFFGRELPGVIHRTGPHPPSSQRGTQLEDERP
ncbi:MAG: hypothetical protein MZV64_28300 [Ignavibacteriales bacterium]|nr:hypothetical protein [Ignavibacteriales bacterium]